MSADICFQSTSDASGSLSAEEQRWIDETCQRLERVAAAAETEARSGRKKSRKRGKTDPETRSVLLERADWAAIVNPLSSSRDPQILRIIAAIAEACRTVSGLVSVELPLQDWQRILSESLQTGRGCGPAGKIAGQLGRE